MNAYRSKVCVKLLLAAAVCLGAQRATHAGDQKFVQEIKNVTETIDVNDLHIKFTGKVNSAKVDIKGGMQGGTSDDKTQYDWPSSQGWWVDHGTAVALHFEADGEVGIDADNSYWTLNGAKVIGAFKKLGAAPDLSYDVDPHSGQIQAYVTFSNPEPFPVLYSQIRIFKNNNLNAYFDDWLTPSGNLVQGLPRRVLLQPGQWTTLSIGSVQPWTYVLTLAAAEEAGKPNDKYALASGLAIVP